MATLHQGVLIAALVTATAALGLALVRPAIAQAPVTECDLTPIGALSGPSKVDVDPDGRGVLVFHKIKLSMTDLRPVAETLSCRVRVDCTIEEADLEGFTFSLRQSDAEATIGLQVLRIGSSVNLTYGQGKPKKVCGIIGFLAKS
jgi:hypothetical protein